ncbi:MAG: tetratricopeptide repeat protein [Myxococcota bacterium]
MDHIEREGFKLLREGKASGAVRQVVRLVASVAEEPGEDTLAYLEAAYRGAKVLAAAGDVEAAISLMNTVPQEVAQDPANGPTVALLSMEIGEGLRRLGDPDAAERVIGLSHGLRRELLGPYHPKTGLSALMAARTCFDQQRYADAHKFFEAAVVGLGPYHPYNAVSYAERAYAVQLLAPDASPFPEFVMSAPLPYWRRLMEHMAATTLQMPLDLRLAVLLNVSTAIEDGLEDCGDLTKPLLVAAHRHARAAGDERTEVLEEVLEERGWAPEPPASEQGSDAMTEAFWRSPDREGDQDMGEQEALFKLFEGAAEASAGRTEPARDAFQCVASKRSDDTLEHWAAKGCLQLMERGWKIRHQQFKPEMRAIEALALAKLPKATRAKVQGIEMVVQGGSLDLRFLGKKLTETQQKRAVKVVQEALAWVTERSEDAA